MENKVLLAKCITLLYRESLLQDRGDNSIDLIKTVLDNVKASDVAMGLNLEREIINGLKSTILEMCNSSIDQDFIDRTDLLQRIRINTMQDDRTYEAISQSILEELSEPGLKRSIMTIRRSISNHFKEQSLIKVLDEAGKASKFNRNTIKDINQFIAELVTQLESLQQTTTSKDPAIVNEIDIGDESGVRDVFLEMLNTTNGDKVYKTGWQDLNNMLQGGLRPGNEFVIGALQHKYKTGFTLSIFGQLALFNRPEPFMKDLTKKPLLLRISFEDELRDNLGFLYQYLKYNETKERVYMKDIDPDYMKDYVRENLQQNGWHVKMIRVDPDQWTYRSIFNKVTEYEAQGYEVKVLMVDYLHKVNKSGCSSGGITGGEISDIFNKLRNFCSSRDMLFISPHQLSTEAKGLLRSGVPEDQFVREVAEKGYWEGNKGLDRIFDVGIIIHLFKFRGETFLSLARDKHRINTIVEDKYKYCLFKFPKAMPLPHDLQSEEKISRSRLKDFFLESNGDVNEGFLA